LAWKLYNDQRAARKRAASRTGQTQDAILSCSTEMGNLADGDLSIQPEVTEQITGAIARLDQLPVKEMRTSWCVSRTRANRWLSPPSAAGRAANELTQAANPPSHTDHDTTERMRGMSKQMEEMSATAARSAEVAQGSVATASAVRPRCRTPSRHDEMREHIQETAKRIKRLANPRSRSVKSWN